jgi:hypothetical protein
MEEKGGDLRGIKPIAEATKIIVQATVDGARALLSRICLPAAEEFGLLLGDKVHTRHSRNALTMLQQAGRLLDENDVPPGSARTPRTGAFDCRACIVVGR